MLRAFGDCVIDPSCFDLRRRGKVVKLEPKVFDVLLHLIEHLDRVVTKQELLDELWPGEAVSDSVLPRCIAAMRRAVGDTRARQRVIATVHGRGYRFVASLKEVEAAASDLGSESTKSSLSVPGSEAPRHVAVPPDSDFVGREAAMKRLAAGLERAEAGQGGISLVVGEPGIGKTRIADEISVIAAEAGFEVLIGRCYEGGVLRPIGPGCRSCGMRRWGPKTTRCFGPWSVAAQRISRSCFPIWTFVSAVRRA